MNEISIVYEVLTGRLKNSGTLLEVSENFAKLKNDFDRVELCCKLLDEYGVYPEISEPSKKCSLESERLRNEGNSAFLKKDDLLAIQSYSSSVAFSDSDSKEIALAFANRSAVSFSLKEYHDSIKDIDRALAGKYPDNLRYKLYERKGKCLLQLKDKVSAKENYGEALKWVTKSTLSEEKILSLQLSLKLNLEEVSNPETECTRQIQCPDEKYQTSGPNIIPTLSYKQNNEITSSSDALRIEYMPELGRHVVATTDIHAGDVLAIERPFVSVLLSSAYTLHCFHCLKRCHSLIPCTVCTQVLFCSSECRERSWLSYHSVDCSVLPNLIKFGCGKLELLSFRTLLCASKIDKLSDLLKYIDSIKPYSDPRKVSYNEANKYDSTDYRTLHFLARNSELRTNADLFMRSLFAACIIYYIENCSNYFKLNIIEKGESDFHYLRRKAGGLLLRYMQIMPVNAHEVSEMFIDMSGKKKKKCNNIYCKGDESCDRSYAYESVEIAGALLPFLSLINHSCDPNVVRHCYNGDTVVLTALQEIKKGDQILDNYGFHYATHNLETRQSHLKEQYHFTCTCVACTSDWGLYNELPETDPIYIQPLLKEKVEKSSGEFQPEFEDVVKGRFEGKLPFFYRHLSLLHNAIQRPWAEYSKCQEAIKQCLSVQANHYILRKNS